MTERQLAEAASGPGLPERSLLRRSALPVALVVCFLGALDASVLLVAGAQGVAGVCGSTCTTVLQSRFSNVVGVPLALLGLVHYAALLAATALGAASLLGRLSWAPRALAAVGLAVSVLLSGIQVLAIGEVCPLCATSAVLSLLAFVAILGSREARSGRVALALVLVLDLAVVATGLFAWRHAIAQRHASGPAPRADLDLSRARIAGSARAPVVVSVFFDHECPHCRELDPILSALRAGSGGRVAVAFFAHPLPQHKGGRLAARLVDFAASEGRFEEANEAAFRLEKLDLDSLLALARDLGLDPERARASLERKEAAGWTSDTFAEAKRWNVWNVPTIYVNGELYTGERTLEALERAVADLPQG